MYEVNELDGYVEVVELLDHQVPLYGAENRAEVNEEDSGKVSL